MAWQARKSFCKVQDRAASCGKDLPRKVPSSSAPLAIETRFLDHEEYATSRPLNASYRTRTSPSTMPPHER